MSKLLNFSGKNYVPFKEFEFDFSKPGLFQIFGDNQDVSEEATNGAGKTRLLSGLAELMFDMPVNDIKEAKVKTTRDIQLSSTFVGVDDRVYTATRFWGKHNELKLERDGVALKNRKLDYSLARLQELFGQSEEEFYSFSYIDAKRGNPLVSGKSVERHKYFVNLFRLQETDDIRKLLLLEYRDVQKASAIYGEVTDQYKEIKDKALTADELLALQSELDELVVKQERLMNKFNKAQHAAELVAFERDNAKLLKRVKALTGDIEDFEASYESTSRVMKVMRSELKQAQAWADYERDLRQYKKKAGPIKAQLKELGVSQKDAAKAADVYDEKRSALKGVETRLEDLIIEVIELPNEPKYSIDICTDKVSQYREELSHVKEFKTGKCPTCGQRIKDARPIDAVQSDYDRWKEQLAKAKEYEAAVVAKAAADKAQSRRSSLLQEHKGLKLDISKAKAGSEAHKLWETLPEQPDEPKTGSKSIESIEARIEEVRAQLATFEQAEPLLDKIKEVAGLTDEDRASVEATANFGIRLQEINSRVGQLQSKITVTEEQHKQMRALKSRSNVLKEQVADEPILKALIEVHSAKGLQKLLVARYAQVVQDNLNKYRRIAFPEDYTFEIQIGTQFNVLVHRQYGKKIETSDVRKLSGAESMLFTLLLMASTLSLVPAKRRTNFLILDEPAANMSKAHWSYFSRMLQVLLKIVPTIIIITPKSEERYEGATIYTVVRKNGVSRLVEGSTTTEEVAT